MRISRNSISRRSNCKYVWFIVVHWSSQRLYSYCSQHEGLWWVFFLLEYLLASSIIPKIIYAGSKIMYSHVQRGLNIRILDSLNFLPMRLADLPKAFGLRELKKGYFPHFLNTKGNACYVGSYPAAHFYGCDMMNAGNGHWW